MEAFFVNFFFLQYFATSLCNFITSFSIMVPTIIFSSFMGHALLQQLVAHMDQKQALAEVKGWTLWSGGAMGWPSLPGKLFWAWRYGTQLGKSSGNNRLLHCSGELGAGQELGRGYPTRVKPCGSPCAGPWGSSEEPVNTSDKQMGHKDETWPG